MIYYNELDARAAAALRALIREGLVPAGDVDERSIKDVTAGDLRGYRQCHFFAGIGTWAAALVAAQWPDDVPVWSGSCPCQPFSQAGRGAGMADERHLWPHWHHLIIQCRPAVVFGEQVASKDGRGWLDLVRADLEAADYACGGMDTPAASVGAPHIRQRLYWVAHTASAGWQGGGHAWAARQGGQGGSTQRSRALGGLADADGAGLRPGGEGLPPMGHRPPTGADCSAGWVGHTDSDRAGGNCGAIRGPLPGDDREQRADDAGAPGAVAGSSPTDGFWRAADWLLCRDGKWRPVEPGTSPLVDGAAGRVGALRAFGNGIVLPQAVAFAEVVKEVLTCSR